MAITTAHAEEIRRYVGELAAATPPVNGRIRVRMFDRVAFIDEGALTIGPRGEVKVPPDVRSAAHELHLPVSQRGHFARRWLAIEKGRHSRYLIVLERETVRVDGVPTVRRSGSILYWNGRSGMDARLT